MSGQQIDPDNPEQVEVLADIIAEDAFECACADLSEPSAFDVRWAAKAYLSALRDHFAALICTVCHGAGRDCRPDPKHNGYWICGRGPIPPPNPLLQVTVDDSPAVSL